MKRFEFSLDRLLRVKRQVERIAELEQQRAREAVEKSRQHLQSLHEQLDRVSEHYSSSIGTAMAPHQWASASDTSERLGHSIASAERELETDETRLLAAAQERASVATEVEALATLRQQQWDEWSQQARQADQSRLDEVGLRLWMAQQSPPEAA